MGFPLNHNWGLWIPYSFFNPVLLTWGIWIPLGQLKNWNNTVSTECRMQCFSTVTSLSWASPTIFTSLTRSLHLSHSLLPLSPNMCCFSAVGLLISVSIYSQTVMTISGDNPCCDLSPFSSFLSSCAALHCFLYIFSNTGPPLCCLSLPLSHSLPVPFSLCWHVSLWLPIPVWLPIPIAKDHSAFWSSSNTFFTQLALSAISLENEHI